MPRTCDTARRRPRMIAFPPKISGLYVIRSSSSRSLICTSYSPIYSPPMCGINGIFAYGASAAPVDREELVRSRECMRSRGPDAADVWVSDDGRVGLGHRRLAIIDLSPAGAQPMQRGALAIIFNGEIYNFRELRARLEAKGRTFTSHSDTEVMLYLYEEMGAEM